MIRKIITDEGGVATTAVVSVGIPLYCNRAVIWNSACASPCRNLLRTSREGPGEAEDEGRAQGSRNIPWWLLEL